MSSDNEDQEMLCIPEDALALIASPLVTGKLLKKLHKLVSKATKDKAVKRGVKETVKAIRKGSKGYLIHRCCTPCLISVFLDL